jgi:serine/threonine protein kinase
VEQDVRGRDVVKLADFGLSMVVTEPLHTVCGTPTYVAPEIISEDPSGYGLEADMWAIGVIAYILLCGFPPFASVSKNQRDLFDRIKAGRFSFPDPYWRGTFSSLDGVWFLVCVCVCVCVCLSLFFSRAH